MRLGETSTPAEFKWSNNQFPSRSSEKVLSSLTLQPRRARFSATFLATPPGLTSLETGFEVPILKGSDNLNLRSRLAPPIHKTLGFMIWTLSDLHLAVNEWNLKGK